MTKLNKLSNDDTERQRHHRKIGRNSRRLSLTVKPLSYCWAVIRTPTVAAVIQEAIASTQDLPGKRNSRRNRGESAIPTSSIKPKSVSSGSKKAANKKIVTIAVSKS